MQKLTSEEGRSTDLVSENVECLKELFPEVCAEGGINFDILRQLLGDVGVLDEGEEKFGFNWHGKKKARHIALTPSTGTLLPCPEESVDWDTTKNIFIEGDNLQVLKLLQKSYANKIKMIYIDPPYNRDKDFIYPDKFQEDMNTYLRYTGQIDDEGFKLSSDTEKTGRRHTRWLNMIYPRLKLAHSLLKRDGVIFISIDDREGNGLQAVCNEIYGEENFLGRIIWKNATDNNPTNIAIEHEYILVYCKNRGELEPVWKSAISDVKEFLVKKGEELAELHKNPEDLKKAYAQWYKANKSQLWPLDRYKYIDHDGIYTGSQSVHNPGREGYRYDVIHPKTGKPCKQPLMGYRFPKETMDNLIEKDKILYGETHEKIIELKLYVSEYKEKLSSVIEIDGRLGAYDTKSLFPEYKKVFDNPKPIRLLSSFIPLLAKNSEDIILDFFAGSSTTAHSVMEINSKDGEYRRFIMVQLPEQCSEKSEPYKKGIQAISDLSIERIKRVAMGYKQSSTAKSSDYGFKLFKLSCSNIHQWNPNRDDIEESLISHEDHLIDGRSEHDILYEILLKRGIDLAISIESKKVGGKTVYSADHGQLFACLSKSITTKQVEKIGQCIVSWHQELTPEHDSHIFFRDSAFKDDISKTNMVAILEQNGLPHVRSL